MYDAIVIGARCAGAATAMLLAREGHRVLLVDRARFPSEIPHGHFIHFHGPRRLAAWGLLDPLLTTNCPPVTSVTVDLGDFPLAGAGLAVDGVPMGLGPRRSRLDKVLVDAAVDAGAELRQGFAVHGFTGDGDRITGIRGREAPGGATVVERAEVVVGADGRNSSLARHVGAPVTEGAPTVCCWYFSYWSGVPGTALEISIRDQRAVFAFPTNDGLYALFVGWPATELRRVKADPEAALLSAADSVPGLGERLRGGRREERLFGATQLPNFVRRPWGEGWALVGDAGCHKDPLMALGVCDALRDADLLAEALDDALAARRPLADALAGYERARDEATLPDFRENLAAARFTPPPPQVLGIRAAIRGDQEATDHFFLAREGMVAPESFFNDENLGRLMQAARARPPEGRTG